MTLRTTQPSSSVTMDQPRSSAFKATDPQTGRAYRRYLLERNNEIATYPNEGFLTSRHLVAGGRKEKRSLAQEKRRGADDV